MSNYFVSFIKLAISMTIIGSFVVVNKIVTTHFPVFLASELRLAIGTILLFPCLLIKEKKLPCFSSSDSLIFLAQSFIGVFLFSVFMLYGLRYTSALESGIITSLTPAIVGLISHFFLKETLQKRQVTGICLAIIGTLLINVLGMISDTKWTLGSFYGNLLIFAAIVGEAVFVTFGKLVSKGISPLTISTMMCTISSVLFLPFSIYDALHFNFSHVTMLDWLLIFYSGVFVTVIAVLLLNQALTNMETGTAAVFTAIMPISAILLSCLLLKEPFHWYHLLGICFTLSGLLLITRKPPVPTLPSCEVKEIQENKKV